MTMLKDSQGNTYRIISQWTPLIASIPGRRGNHSDCFRQIDKLNNNPLLTLHRLGSTNTYRAVDSGGNFCQMFAEIIKCYTPTKNGSHLISNDV